MSHIPEDELHAYLDQALGRSQCVVIESHLASCADCRRERDAIAALRDRTTLLLGQAAPARRIAPSFEALQRRAVHAPVSRRARLLRRGIMAASLVGAIGIGYALRSLEPAPEAATAQQPVLPVPMPVAAPDRAGGQPDVHQVAEHRSSPARARVPAGIAVDRNPAVPPAPVVAAITPPASIELSTDTLPQEETASLVGLWRTVPWDAAEQAAGREPSRLIGVPVEQVQVQPSSREGGKPVTVVAQRLSSGEVIQTIEGPAADVTQLLSRSGDGGLDSAGRSAQAVRSGDRLIVVTGQLPSDSLRAMARRVNAGMRVR